MEGAREAVAHQVLVTDAERPRTRSATRWSARRSTATCCRARTPTLHARIAAAIEADPRCSATSRGDGRRRARLPLEERPRARAARSARSVRAGIGAKRVYAYEVAQRQFERALGLWDRVPDAAERAGVDRAEVLRLAATCAGARGEASRAVALHPRGARGTSTRRRSRCAPPRSTSALGNWLRSAGESERELRGLRPRRRAAARRGPSVERARVLEDARARRDAARRTAPGARRPSSAALEDARAVGAERTEVRALNTLGFSGRARRGGGGHRHAARGAARAARGRPADRSRAA